jgi:hypothetical protein
MMAIVLSQAVQKGCLLLSYRWIGRVVVAFGSQFLPVPGAPCDLLVKILTHWLPCQGVLAISDPRLRRRQLRTR